MDCAWVVGLRKDCKIALGLGRLGLLEGAGKAALLLSSMTLHDLCAIAETGRNGRTVGPRTPSWFYKLRHNRSSIAIGF